MKYFFWIILVLFLVYSNNTNAQLSDIARIDYTLLPSTNSSIEYSRVRALFNYPIKLKKEGTYLLLGIDYSNIDITGSSDELFNSEELDSFQLFDFNIGYTTPLKNDWRLGARITPGISSNLSATDISIEDFVISADLVFIKDKTKNTGDKKPWRITAGLSFSQNRGFPFPLPFIVYYKKFHKNWSYKLGIPQTNLQWHIADKHRLKLYAEIDGFTSNLQEGIIINGEEADQINMGLILGGLQYEFHIAKHVEFFARLSSVINQSVQLRDDSGDNLAELGGSSNRLYLRTGIRLKI